MSVIEIAGVLLPLLHPLIPAIAANAQMSAVNAQNCFIEPRCKMSCVSSIIGDSAAHSRLNPPGNLFGRISSLCVASGDSDTNPEKKANWLNNKMGWQCQRASLILKDTSRIRRALDLRDISLYSRQPKSHLG
ncbi:MAG: hypothetical protein WA766_13775 [Candidatus Acidiferrales bacterium]